MQIGADIYCDSQCILRELQHRFPEPAYYQANAEGLAWGVSRWTDEKFFKDAIGLVLGGAGADLPAEFVESVAPELVAHQKRVAAEEQVIAYYDSRK